MSTRTVHFKATRADLHSLLTSGGINIDTDHARRTGNSRIWSVIMEGANSVDCLPVGEDPGRSLSLNARDNLTRIDFWIEPNLVRSAVTGTDAQGEPIVTSVNRGPHITMKLRGAHADTFIDMVATAYGSRPDEDHDSPAALLNFFGVTARKVRTIAGVTLLSLTPNEDTPEHEIATPLAWAAHRFA